MNTDEKKKIYQVNRLPQGGRRVHAFLSVVFIRAYLCLSVAAFPLFFSCKPAILAVQKISLCDDFDGKKCVVPQEAVRTYAFQAPEIKKHSWFDLGYYMYFHSRQTPGMRVQFNRSLNETEVATLRESLVCSYRLTKSDKTLGGHIEGRRIDPDGEGFWCFDYLGTMLVKYQKKYGNVQGAPLKSFFPVELTLEFESRLPGIRGEITSTITVDWESAEEAKK